MTMQGEFFGKKLGKVLSSICFVAATVYAQSSCLNPQVQRGPFAVGFKVVHQYDYTRTFKPPYDADGNLESGERARPIQTCIWYPANTPGTTAPMRFEEYVYLMATETNFVDSSEHQNIIGLNSFLRFYRRPQLTVASELKSQTYAFKNAVAVNGKFPIVIYAPSWNAPAWENSLLCEYLASHGYLVFASPCLGVTTRYMNIGVDEELFLEAQARDIEFLLGFARHYPSADIARIALIGFSWGGTSNVLVAFRNSAVNAVISLDGAIRTYYSQYFNASPYESSIKKFKRPFLYLSQKSIPIDSMVAYNMDVSFTFYDSLDYSDAYWITMHKFSHRDFGSTFIRFVDRQSKQHGAGTIWEQASIGDANEGYRLICLYILNFLNGYVKGEKESLEFLKNDPVKNGIPASVLTLQSKVGLKTPQSVSEFAHRLKQFGYKKIRELYTEIRKSDIEFSLKEQEVNSWGYTLLRANKVKEAIEVFSLNTLLYPESSNTYDSLGEAYMVLGDVALAIKNYEQSLALNPGNSNAESMLKILKQEKQ